MTPSAYTPWPVGRPPHMVAVTQLGDQQRQALDNVIENHIERCEECQDWAFLHGRDHEKWIYPSGT